MKRSAGAVERGEVGEMAQLRCEQCGRALPADGGSCPSCGWTPAPVAERDDASTRPVPPEAVARALAGATPVGPARPADGAEPPTMPPVPPLDALAAPVAPGGYAPPPLPRAPAALERTAELPAGLRPALEPTADLPPGSGAGPAGAVNGAANGAAVGRSGASRARLTVLSAVALLVVLLVGSAAVVLASNGGLAGLLGQSTAATPTPAPATATPTGAAVAFARYTAADGSYMIEVPSTWRINPGAGFVQMVDPRAGDNFDVLTTPGKDDPAIADQQAITSLAASLAGGQGTASTSHTVSDMLPLAGALWNREAADIAVTSGGQTVGWHAVALALQHGQHTLVVVYVARAAIFAAEDATYFQPMLNSLVLTDSGS